MPVLPNPISYELLADWLEILALQSADRNASLSDLERALRRGSVAEASEDHEQPHERIEQELSQVGRELRDRIKGAGNAYPFEFNNSVLQFAGLTPLSVPYLFCLLVSASSWLSHATKKHEKEGCRLFEHLSRVVAHNYLGGDSLHFGSPRTELPKGFAQAVTELCRRLGEGGCFKNQPALNRKDDGLDIVAWKTFPDELPGKLILFGQCATGKDWKHKLSELHPRAFCGQWMEEPPSSPLLSAFFVPHRIPFNEWTYVVRHAGIVFDRCRIAKSSDPLLATTPFKELNGWVAHALASVAKGQGS